MKRQSQNKRCPVLPWIVPVLSFGLISCGLDGPARGPGAGKVTVWALPKPLIERENGSTIPFSEFQTQGMAQISLNDAIAFSGAGDHPTGDFTLKTTAACTDTKNKVFTLVRQQKLTGPVRIIELMPPEIFSIEQAGSNETLRCDFEFIAQDGQSNQHRFFLLRAQIPEAGYGWSMAFRRGHEIFPSAAKTIAIGDQDLPHFRLEWEREGAFDLRLDCTFFTAQTTPSHGSGMEMSAIRWDEAQPKVSLAGHPVDLRPRQTCRFLALTQEGFVTALSPVFFLHWRVPPVLTSVKVLPGGLQPLPRNWRGPLINVHFTNENTFPVYYSLGPVLGNQLNSVSVIGAGPLDPQKNHIERQQNVVPIEWVPYGGAHLEQIAGVWQLHLPPMTSGGVDLLGSWSKFCRKEGKLPGMGTFYAHPAGFYVDAHSLLPIKRIMAPEAGEEPSNILETSVTGLTGPSWMGAAPAPVGPGVLGQPFKVSERCVR